MNKKYSIIIPVYNAEHSLARCINSLVDQGRTDIEILLINDGSSDNSHNICQAFSAQYPQIKYLRKENGGVSTARNAGLDIAEGEYILFVDSDDYVSEHYFQTIDSALSSSNSDLLQFSYCKVNGESEIQVLRPPHASSSFEDYTSTICYAICRKTINTPWAKAYRRNLIAENHLRFRPDLSIGEDRLFNIQYALFAKSYCVSNDVIYFVDTSSDTSLSRKKRSNLWELLQRTYQYEKTAVLESELPRKAKREFLRAIDFNMSLGIYTEAKWLHRQKMPFLKRLKQLNSLCDQINAQNPEYPKTSYCQLLTTPIRWKLTPAIDALAWMLVHK